MRKNLLLAITLLMTALSGCSSSGVFLGPHKVPIQQGSKITQDMVDQLRPGMTKAQVRYVLGTPLVVDTFHQDRWDYRYTFVRGNGDPVEEQLTVYFADDELNSFEGDFVTTPEEVLENENTESEQ